RPGRPGTGPAAAAARRYARRPAWAAGDGTGPGTARRGVLRGRGVPAAAAHRRPRVHAHRGRHPADRRRARLVGRLALAGPAAYGVAGGADPAGVPAARAGTGRYRPDRAGLGAALARRADVGPE